MSYEVGSGGHIPTKEQEERERLERISEIQREMVALEEELHSLKSKERPE